MNCEFCDGAKATKRCYYCLNSLELCDECFNNAHKSSERQKHLSDVIPFIQEEIPKYELCSVHSDERCDNFCIDCNKLLCYNCMILDGHKKHKHFSISN